VEPRGHRDRQRIVETNVSSNRHLSRGEVAVVPEFRSVDLLILCNRKIRVIVEIEEADLTPTQIAGKFLTSALASHFNHDRQRRRGDPAGCAPSGR
jgi:hypothetical protein